MTKPLLLCEPVSFLILCNTAEHCPSFCRALISIITKYDQLPLGWQDYSQESDKSEPSMNVIRWYNILIQDSDEIVHGFHQMCLNYPVVQPNLRRLCKEDPCSRNPGIKNFEKEYPVLLDAL